MADAANDIANSLLGKLTGLLTAGQQEKQAFISVVDGGYALDPVKDLGFLSTEDRTSADMQQAANFASLVDRLPTAVGSWDPSGAQLSETFRTVWLGTAQVPSVQLTDQQKADLTAAQKTLTDDGTTYVKYRNQWQQATAAIATLEAKTPRPADYGSQLLKLRQAQSNATQAWQDFGDKQVFEQAQATVAALTRQGYNGIVENLQTTYDDYITSFTDSTGSNFAPVWVIPPDFATSDQIWNQFTFTSQEVEKYIHDSKVSFGGGLTGMEDLFWFSVSASGTETRTYEKTDSTNFSVSFEYARVALDRSPWFDTFLLESQAWWWPGATKQDPLKGGMTFSNGAVPPATGGEWQMIPQDALFTRNLSIELDMSSTTNQTMVTDLKEQASVGFLFFRIGGESSSFHSSDTKYTFTQTSNGIFAPQLQLSAFVCSLMPKEPNPAIDLLPES